jgi:hypothetical protein
MFAEIVDCSMKRRSFRKMAGDLVRGHGNADGISEQAIALFYLKFCVTMDQLSMVI